MDGRMEMTGLCCDRESEEDLLFWRPNRRRRFCGDEVGAAMAAAAVAVSGRSQRNRARS